MSLQYFVWGHSREFLFCFWNMSFSFMNYNLLDLFWKKLISKGHVSCEVCIFLTTNFFTPFFLPFCQEKCVQNILIEFTPEKCSFSFLKCWYLAIFWFPDLYDLLPFSRTSPTVNFLSQPIFWNSFNQFVPPTPLCWPHGHTHPNSASGSKAEWDPTGYSCCQSRKTQQIHDKIFLSTPN